MIYFSCTSLFSNQLNITNNMLLLIYLNYTLFWRICLCLCYLLLLSVSLSAFCVHRYNGSCSTCWWLCGQDLGVHCELCDNGYWQLSLFSPYWMINKTCRDLAYKVCKMQYIFKQACAHALSKRQKTGKQRQTDTQNLAKYYLCGTYSSGDELNYCYS